LSLTRRWTDRQADRHLAIAQSALCIASRGKNCPKTWKVGMFDADGEDTAGREEVVGGNFVGIVGDDGEPSRNDFAAVISLGRVVSISSCRLVSCRTVLSYIT